MNLILSAIIKKTDGRLINADATPLLCDPTNSFGVRRVDTGDVVVAADMAMTQQSTGVYTYTLSSAVAGVKYEYWPKPIVGGVPYQIQKFITALDPESETYLSTDEASTILTSLPRLASAKRATSDVLAAALLMATIDIDAAGPYQGHRFWPRQKLEFPRMAYPGPGAALPPIPLYLDPFFWPEFFSGMIVWDWSDDLCRAHVPFKVKLATLIQADSVIAGDRDQRIQDIQDGLTQQDAGGVMEQYRQDANPSRLCDRARRIMDYYVLRQGKLL